MVNPATSLRRELAFAYAERDRHRKSHEKTLKTWTDERTRMLENIRVLRKRERVLIHLLNDYLAGNINEEQALAKITKVRE